MDRLFNDRDVFADFFTRYYTDCEPEHCLVACAGESVVGYLIGCLHYRRYPFVQAGIVAATLPRIAWRIVRGCYHAESLRFMRWFALRAKRETPRVPSRSAHFHINILPGWRNGRVARRLIFPFIEKLPHWGARRVYGQIQVYDDRRPLKVFERYGFHMYDQRRVSKFERFGKPGVYVTTFYRDLNG